MFGTVLAKYGYNHPNTKDESCYFDVIRCLSNGSL